MARNVKFGDAVSSAFLASVTVLDSVEPTLQRVGAVLSNIADTVESVSESAFNYAERMRMSSLQGLQASIEEIGGFEELAKLEELSKQLRNRYK
jgi:hypothetical protein|nr:MAG TPA: hypothetical protein [Caudoviricetes sp.]